MLNEVAIENRARRREGWESDMMRLVVIVPKKLHWAYKSKLAASGGTIQEDIENHLVEMVKNKA